MKFQQIRNATVKITYDSKTFLIDPWLAPQYMTGCFWAASSDHCHESERGPAQEICDRPLRYLETCRSQAKMDYVPHAASAHVCCGY